MKQLLEAIKAKYLAKYLCLHDWEVLHKAKYLCLHVYDGEVLHKTEYVTYWEILLKCKKCGKLRKKRV